MDEHFTCRNGHHWGVSIEGPAAINGRWVFCPVCGAPPRPVLPLPAWQRFGRWVQRNPVALGLSASVLVMLMSFGVMGMIQWRDMRAQIKQAEAEVERALREADALHQRPISNPAARASQTGWEK
jgi:hypothetical protein